MKETSAKQKKQFKIIGWREWLTLPDLGVKSIKAKIDTGARTSSLHAHDMTFKTKGKKIFVDFIVHPSQRDTKKVVHTSAEVLEFRKVKNSGGKVTLRPVILTTVQLGSISWKIEVTLIGRDEMGFRMLLGRQAIRKLFLVDPSQSFVQSSTL